MVRKVSIVLLCLAAAMAGCGRGQADIPSGAQQLHVTVTETEIRLDPPTVTAGDLYVVLDTPGSSVGFAQIQRTADATPGPMTDDDLDRFARGDLQGTALTSFDDTGCSAEQRAEDRGRLGPCGNVDLVTLSAGKYAFHLLAADGITPRAVTVLEVLP